MRTLFKKKYFTKGNKIVYIWQKSDYLNCFLYITILHEVSKYVTFNSKHYLLWKSKIEDNVCNDSVDIDFRIFEETYKSCSKICFWRGINSQCNNNTME